MRGVVSKATRHATVREILETMEISNQDDLRLELRKRGVRTTQATLSRDLRELGVNRIALGEKSKYVLQPLDHMHIRPPVVSAQVLTVRANESTIIIRTLPGSAGVIGEFIDAMHHEHIMGTIAGDNTLLVVPVSHKRISTLVQILKAKLLEGEA